ncbi:exo-beta-D-glucosaminidase, partial [Amycolatopsis sp. NPDC059657]
YKRQTTEGLRLRNHPSILSFYVGSDTAPTPRIEQEYLDGLAVSDWDTPVITSITWRESPQLGPSGNKGYGPYWWVPPNYWYGDQRGGAFGFEAEHGPGPAIPELTALKKILSPKELDKLWKDGESVQFHLSPSEHFDKLAEFYTALVERYGKPHDLEDFVMKAQLAGYETNRAQFEAFGANQSKADRPATGMIYWLLNNAWPSLFWHLYDHSMTPSGGYFGAKKAMRPLHVQYTYDDGMVALVNTGLTEVPGLSIQTTVLDENGVALHDETTPATAPANGAARLVDVPLPEGVSTTYFLRLQLRDSAGKLLDRNVYWLSTKPDTLDYEAPDWRTTPQVDYADYTDLSRIPEQKVNVKAASKATGDDITTTVTMTNSGSKVAFFLRATVTKGSAEDEVAPAVWSDDYVTIWPGESTTLTAQYRRSDLGSATPTVKVGGVNVENLRVTAPIK